jgi:hypoxanthine phosphoribosyltransferase
MDRSRNVRARPAGDLYRDVARVVISRARLRRRVRELARQIALRYAGEELAVVGALCGAMIFLADLVRQLPLRVTLHMVGIRSYAGPATRPRGLDLYLPLDADLRGRHVLVVDDILDGGKTLRTMMEMAAAMRPASLRSCVLLRKGAEGELPMPRAGDSPTSPDFVGFQVGPEFVVGYGLDFDGRYRNLPEVCVLKRHARRGRTRR